MAVIEQGIQEAGWGPGVSSLEDGGCGQRDRALQRANEARIDGAAVKRELRVGVLELARALADPRAGSVKVRDLVLCVPGIGAVKARLLLRELGIRETKRARELTARQRRAISEAVGGASGGRPGTYPPGRPDGAAVIEQEV